MALYLRMQNQKREGFRCPSDQADLFRRIFVVLGRFDYRKSIRGLVQVLFSFTPLMVSL